MNILLNSNNINKFKNTLLYDFILCKNIYHFKVIKTFRNCYIETFRINGITGYFSWDKDENKENTILTLEKNNKLLKEITYINDNIYSKINLYDTNGNQLSISNISKDCINPLIINTVIYLEDGQNQT